MRIISFVTLFAVLLVSPVFAQQTSFQDPLLDQFAGKWVLRGTIDGKETTHDIEAAWVLAHQYMQIHEVSREKDAKGDPAYEAIVYIGWDQHAEEYDCLWLDVTGGGGLTGQGIGHAKRESSQIAFVFKSGGSILFHNTFVRDGGADAWRWVMDGDENGKLQPFGRLTLTRK